MEFSILYNNILLSSNLHEISQSLRKLMHYEKYNFYFLRHFMTFETFFSHFYLCFNLMFHLFNAGKYVNFMFFPTQIKIYIKHCY